MANVLDMDPDSMSQDEDFVQFVAGTKVIKDSIPLSHRYGGYQFGYWASQLGDGRAILLGEYVNAHQQRIELQLKGAGKTPYSRFGDGRAVKSLKKIMFPAWFGQDRLFFCADMGRQVLKFDPKLTILVRSPLIKLEH